MTVLQGKSNRFFGKILMGIALLLFIGLTVYFSATSHKRAIQQKLIGSWNIEYENSLIERDRIHTFLGRMHIRNRREVRLPEIYEPLGADLQGKTFLDSIFNTEEARARRMEQSNRMRQNATGTWQIISTNPDSILINAPNHPLHGRYAIYFFIDREGWVYARNNIYKMELMNDSTYFLFNKGGITLPRELRMWHNLER